MLLSAISKLLASLLASSLVGIVLTLTLTQTILSSHYLEGKLQSTNSYERLSVALSDQLSKDIKGIGADQARLAFTHILTPQVLQTKITNGLDQMQAYYQGDGPVPTIDLTDVAAQAQAAGIPIPADSAISKPITLGPSKKSNNYGKTIATLWWTTIASTVLFAVGLVLVCHLRRKWTALPNVLIATGVLLGILALLLAVGSSAISHGARFNDSSNAFSVLGRDLAVVIAKDVASRLGLYALIIGMLGIGTRIVVGHKNGQNPNSATPVNPVAPLRTPLIR